MGTVQTIVEQLVKDLKDIKEQAELWLKQHDTTRNKNAVREAKENWEQARMLLMEPNAAVPSKLKDLYFRTKELEENFNKKDKGDYTYAGLCHGNAKNFFWKAMLDIKDAGMTIASFETNIVPIFQCPDPLKGDGNTFEYCVQVKSGYAQDTAVDSELHTKILAKAKVGAQVYAGNVEASISAERAQTISNSWSISNTAETDHRQVIKLNLNQKVFIYQTSFSAMMADGTITKGWGNGHIVTTQAIPSISV